jgi:hypothetical protein
MPKFNVNPLTDIALKVIIFVSDKSKRKFSRRGEVGLSDQWTAVEG